MRPRRRYLTLIAGLLFGSLAAGRAPASTCSSPVLPVPALGRACTVDGGYRVMLPSGGSIFTHGPDPVPGPVPAGSQPDHSSTGFVAPPLPPLCVDTSEPHGEVLYVHATDAGNQYQTRAPMLKALFEMINGQLRVAAARGGARGDFKMLCDSNGTVTVKDVPLSTTASAATFGSIIGDLQSLGYSASNAKYWVLFEGHFNCTCGGLGSLDGDDRPDDSNANQLGPDYGMAFLANAGGIGAYVAVTLMHEDGHNLGAVQLSSPHTTGAYHCNDGSDVMCYADGGPQAAYQSSACPLFDQYDCGGDDYFNVAPAPGSYLATHWNLARSRFLSVGLP